MTGYPEGAGPTAGAFGGVAYTTPTTLTSDTTATATDRRPEYVTQAASVVDGKTVAVFTPPTSEVWLVRRIVVQSDTSGRAYVYVGDPIPENLVSGTYSGEFDENDANQPYLVPEGVPLTIEWPSAGECMARIEYDVIGG